MSETSTNYTLEQRCITFAKQVNQLIPMLPKTTQNNEYGKQLIRSCGSIGANYLEANSSLGFKDFIHRCRIARKEARESQYWLMLLNIPEAHIAQRDKLAQECLELAKILSAIIRNATSSGEKSPRTKVSH